MSPLDIGLLALLALAALLGYRRGFLVGLLAFVGLVAGALLGVVLAVRMVRSWVPGPHQTFIALLVVVVVISLAQGVLSVLGHQLKRRLHWKPGRLADAALGSIFNILTVLVLVWGATVALGQTPVPGVNQAINNSVVLRTIGTVAPSDSQRLLASFRMCLFFGAYAWEDCGRLHDRFAKWDHQPRSRLLTLCHLSVTCPLHNLTPL